MKQDDIETAKILRNSLKAIAKDAFPAYHNFYGWEWMEKDMFVKRSEWLAENANMILRFVRDVKDSACRRDNFKKKLLEAQKIFATLNDYEKNRGNLKLSKRIEKLIKQFEQYEKGGKVATGVKEFFDDMTGLRIPSIGNVLTLIEDTADWVLFPLAPTRNMVKKRRDLVHGVVKDVFNGGYGFKRDYTYKAIILEDGERDYILGSWDRNNAVWSYKKGDFYLKKI